MAFAGEVIDNPVTHQRIVYRETAQDTKGELLKMEFTMEPSSFIVGGLHLHPSQQETFTALQGTVRFIVDGKEQSLSAGHSMTVTPGNVHDWWNRSGQAAKVEVEFRPALRYESYFETVFGLARDGKTSDRGFPKPLLQAAVIYYDFRESVRPGQPLVRFLTRLLLPIVAPIGKLLGYRSTYPRYTNKSSGKE